MCLGRERGTMSGIMHLTACNGLVPKRSRLAQTSMRGIPLIASGSRMRHNPTGKWLCHFRISVAVCITRRYHPIWHLFKGEWCYSAILILHWEGFDVLVFLCTGVVPGSQLRRSSLCRKTKVFASSWPPALDVTCIAATVRAVCPVSICCP